MRKVSSRASFALSLLIVAATPAKATDLQLTQQNSKVNHLLAQNTDIQSAAVSSNAKELDAVVGFFNLAAIKKTFPDSVSTEGDRIRAQETLKKAVADGNEMLKRMQSDGKSKSAIEEAARKLQSEINAQQQALIQMVQGKQGSANGKIGTAVANVARNAGITFAVDGSGVYFGGQTLVENGVDLTDQISADLTGSSAPPVTARGSVRLRIGYFSIDQVKVATSVSKEADQFRIDAEMALQQTVSNGNASLQSAKNAGKSQSEIERMAQDIKASVNAQQTNFIQKSQAMIAESNKRIADAAARVAQRNGLTLLVAGESVYAGGDRVVGAGVDVGKDMIDELK